MKNEKKIDTVNIYECSYYCLLADCINMLEKKSNQKKDFMNLCNSILCMHTDILTQSTYKKHNELFKKLVALGLYN